MQRFSSPVRQRMAGLAVTLAASFAIQSAFAGTIWDGGGADTNINNPLNWDADTAPAFNGTVGVSFGSAGQLATINSDVIFTGITINRTTATGFTLASGGGNLILNSTSSGGTKNLTRSSASGGTDIINAPIQINTTASGTAKLFNVVNNKAGGTMLDINGTIGLASGSTTLFGMRFDSAVGTLTRLDGAISGANNLQPSSANWNGEVLIGGNQSLSTCPITINTAGGGFGTVGAAGKLTLGETSADVQSWGAIQINQGLNVSVGGTITATSLTGTATTARITGSASGTGVLKLTSGTIGAGIALGGAGAGENDFGLLKQNVGTLTLSGDKTFTGSTTVNGGSLVINNAYASPIAVNGGSLTLAGTSSASVTVNAGGGIAGEGATTSALNFGSGSATISFDPTTEPTAFTAASISVAGNVVVAPTSAVTIGTPYTVLKVTGGFGATSLSSFLAGRGDTFSYANGNTELVLTPGASTPLALKWKGGAANPTFWDVATTQNWLNGAAPERFYAGDSVTFDDTASSFSVALQSAVMSPGSVTFNNSANAYTLTGGGIGGAGTITKSGTAAVSIAGPLSNTGGLVVNAGTLTLGSAGTLTGGVILNGGELKFDNLAAINPAANSLTLAGGKVNYTGAVTVTNDVQNISIDANGSGIGVDSPANITWRIGGKVSGSGDWTKSGTGVLSLGRSNNTNPNNDFTGKVTVTGGTLDIRWGDSLGDATKGTEVQDAILLIQNFGQTSGTTVTVAEPLTFMGNSSLTSLSQEVKVFTNQFTGPMSVSGTLGVSTAISSAVTPNTLELIGNTITTSAGSMLALGQQASTYPVVVVAAPQTINVGSDIIGGGSVTTTGAAGSKYTLSGNNTYSGGTMINGGTLSVGSAGALPSGTGKGDVAVNAGATSAGVLDLNGNSASINGLNGSSGAVLGRVVNNSGGVSTLTVGVTGASSTFEGLILDNAGSGGTVAIKKVGAGTLTMTGASTYTGGTTIEGGVLSLGLAANDVVLNAGHITDIKAGKVILSYATAASPAVQVDAILSAGYVGSFTTGSIRSSTATSTRGLGWIDSAGSSTITIAVALYGDNNVDGTVNFDDLLVLAQNYGVASGATWSQGDSNYDHAVNFDDLLALAQAYNSSLIVDLSGFDSSFQSDFTLAMSMVPEPTTLVLVSSMGVMAGRRRRA